MIVKMYPSEIAIAMTLASSRMIAATSGRIIDRQMGKDDPMHIEYIGALGEIAAARVFNVCPDLRAYNRKGGADLVLNNGTRIDVKATTRPDGNLMIHAGKVAGDVDFYLLAVVTGSDVDLVGFMHASQCLVESRLQDKGHGMTYFVDRKELTPVKPGKSTNIKGDVWNTIS